MSVKQMSMVWESDIDGADKLLLLAMADFANDEGQQIFPSVRRLTYKTGQSERSIQRRLSEYRAAGVLEVLNAGVGRGNSTVYALHICKLPKLPPFKY